MAPCFGNEASMRVAKSTQKNNASARMRMHDREEETNLWGVRDDRTPSCDHKVKSSWLSQTSGVKPGLWQSFWWDVGKINLVISPVNPPGRQSLYQYWLCWSTMCISHIFDGLKENTILKKSELRCDRSLKLSCLFLDKKNGHWILILTQQARLYGQWKYIQSGRLQWF